MATALNNAAPASPNVAPPVSHQAPDPPGGPYPSDEEILGIFDETAIASRNGVAAEESDATSSFGRVRPQRSDATAQPEQGSDANATGDGVQNNGAQEAVDLPEWLAQVSAAAPNAAPELANLWQRATALDTFDRAFYGADSAAQQQLITQLYTDDPSALRAMVSAAAQLLDGSARGGDPRANTNGFVARPRFVGAGPFDATTTHPQGTSSSANDRSSSGNQRADPNVADGTENPRPYEALHRPVQDEAGRATNSNATQQSASAQNFNPAAYAQFEQSTNDAVVTDVSRAIERALDRALPDGIADGARRRIATDTLAEVHTALRGDRQLGSQVAGMLRNVDASGAHTPRFDNATRDAIARLIATRARGVVPEAARRVIGEWTGSVLSAHRERSAKQQASVARVDVVGSASQAPVQRRAVKSADINYRATSDEDILSW